MARHTRQVTITADGRDKGKTFILREMPADQGERWANRAILSIANSGADIPDGILDAGMSGLAALKGPMLLVLGIRSLKGMRYAEIDPLLAEMMEFIQFQPLGGFPAQALFDGENSQIEEVSTRWKLRIEYVELMLGFSLAGALSTTDSRPGEPPAS